MLLIARKSLVLLSVFSLTFSPGLSALADGCGCVESVYVAPVVDCWGCSSCYAESCCEAEPIVHHEPCGCSASEPVVQEETCGCQAGTSIEEHGHVHMESHGEVVMGAEETLAPVLEPEVVEQPVTDPQPAVKEQQPVVVEPADASLSVPEETTADEAAPVEVAEPESEPKSTEPTGDFDSMFDEPEETDSTPVEETTTEPTDDFDSMFDEAEETDSTPVEETTSEPEEDSFDDMFSEPAESADNSEATKPAEEATDTEQPAEEPAKADESEDTFEDLFGVSEIPAPLLASGGLHSKDSRRWTDNTGRYHCEARLVSLARGEIVIEKVSGTLKRVSLKRLSENDVQFVYSQVVAQRQFLAKRGLAKKLASLWTD